MFAFRVSPSSSSQSLKLLQSLQTRRLLSGNGPTASIAPQIDAACLAPRIGGKYTISLIEGDGIGVETTQAVRTIFKTLGVPIDWEVISSESKTHPQNASHAERAQYLQRSIESIRRNRIALKGIWHTPFGRNEPRSFNVTLRKELDCFASVVVIQNVEGCESRHKNVNFAIIRENTEGEYAGLEHEPVDGVVESLKIITAKRSDRICKFSFDYALRNNRRRVTCIHKANIMKLADGLFRHRFNLMAEKYPTLEINDLIVDNASMQAVQRPQQFDVLVMPNLYGSILSNISASLIGGPALVPGCTVGHEHAVFEPGCRHVGLDIAGKNMANPTAMLLSAVMMLRHLGLGKYADSISQAVYSVLKEGKHRTMDLGGDCTTDKFTRAVMDKLEQIY